MSTIEATQFVEAVSRLKSVRVQKFGAGYEIPYADRATDTFLIVMDGALDERWTTENGRYMIARQYSVGDIISPGRPDLVVWDQISLVATTAGEIAKVDQAAFWQFMHEQIDRSQYYFSVCEKQLTNLASRLADAQLLPLRVRLRRELLRRMHENADGSSAKRIYVGSHDEFAVYFGTSRESISREIAQLRDLGLIKSGRGHITVKDPEALQDQA
jgi:CRP-like cAMP-binding protein